VVFSEREIDHERGAAGAVVAALAVAMSSNWSMSVFTLVVIPSIVFFFGGQQALPDTISMESGTECEPFEAKAELAAKSVDTLGVRLTRGFAAGLALPGPQLALAGRAARRKADLQPVAGDF